MTKTYDTKSFELAEHFLADVKGLSDEQQRTYADRLAKTIQGAIEDELEAIATEAGVELP